MLFVEDGYLLWNITCNDHHHFPSIIPAGTGSAFQIDECHLAWSNAASNRAIFMSAFIVYKYIDTTCKDEVIKTPVDWQLCM